MVFPLKLEHGTRSFKEVEMPGFLLHFGAQVQCAHVGQAVPVTVNPRVLVSGQPVVTMASTYTIAGCTFPAMTSGAPPCATAQWLTGATRVFAGGLPVLMIDSVSICAPTGTPLLILGTQTRVVGM
jgi:hypothetical protein